MNLLKPLNRKSLFLSYLHLNPWQYLTLNSNTSFNKHLLMLAGYRNAYFHLFLGHKKSEQKGIICGAVRRVFQRFYVMALEPVALTIFQLLIYH